MCGVCGTLPTFSLDWLSAIYNLHVDRPTTVVLYLPKMSRVLDNGQDCHTTAPNSIVVSTSCLKEVNGLREVYRPDLKPYPLPVKPRTGTKRKLTGNTPYTEPESKTPHLSRKRKQSLDSGEPPYTSKLEAKKPKQSPSSSKCKQNKASKPRRINPPPPPPPPLCLLFCLLVMTLY